MPDMEKVIRGLRDMCDFIVDRNGIMQSRAYIHATDDAIAMLMEQEAMRCKNCRNNLQCAIQFKFADADDEENWFCKNFTPSSGQNDGFIKNVADISKNIAHQRIIHKLARFALENHVEDILTQERLAKILLWTDETIDVLKEHLFCADSDKDGE